jgi:hypothetical protein
MPGMSNEETSKVKIELRVSDDEVATPESDAVKGSRPNSPAPVGNYQTECLALRAGELLKACSKAKLHEEAELLSRLLVDIQDGAISAAEALSVLSQIESHTIQVESRKSHRAVNSRDLSLHSQILIFFGGVFVIAILQFCIGNSISQSARVPTQAPQVEKPLVTTPVAFDWKFFRQKPADIAEFLRSQNSATSTDFTITNTTKNAVSIYWRDFAGNRVLYMTLAAGSNYNQRTFATHPWEVVLDPSGETLLWFVPGSQQGAQIDIASAMRNAR